MAGNKAAIKARIKSINTTKKITGAMELISTVKLQKHRNQMEKTIEYNDTLNDVLIQILSGENDVNSEYLIDRDIVRKVFIVFCSDMGLCGGYNINVNKIVFNEVNKDDYLILIGTKLYSILKRSGYNIINDPISLDKADYTQIKKCADQAINLYKDNEVGSIQCIYTKFVNNVTFQAINKKVLPVTIEKQEKTYKQILFEPSPEAIIEDLIPLVVQNEIYRLFNESRTSEQGNRRFAMENATNNANDLNDKLLLAYNQARQAAITSEITEIVAGADAL